MKKKVIFDISVLGTGYMHDDSRTGVYRVSEVALKTFLSDEYFDVYFYPSAKNDEECKKYLEHYFPDLNKKFIPSQKFKFRRIFKYLFSSRYDLYFSPYFAIPKEYRLNLKIKKVIIIYDLIQVLHKEWCQKSCSDTYEKFLKRLDNNALALCISEHTKHDLINWKTKLKLKNIFTIPLGADEKYNPDYTLEDIKRVKDKYGIKYEKYFFSISSLNPRKNFKHTVKCFIDFINKYKLTDLSLVISGPKGWGNIFDDIDISKYKNQIVFTGYVDEEDLLVLYKGAMASVYLSLYEGFGLPPLESIYCNTPVIASNTTSIPEVVGKAGILIDPFDKDALINAYKEIYDGNILFDDFRKEADKQKRIFNWHNFSKRLLEVIK